MEHASPGVTAKKFRNYDVLLMPIVEDKPLRFAPGNHVGNQRFRVLLNIFRQRYLQAVMFGHEHECKSIARDVYDTLCNRCVPNGRFFEKGCDDRWHQIGYDSLSSVVMKALKNDPQECVRSTKRVRRRPPGFELLHKAASERERLPVSGVLVRSPNPFDVVCEANGLKLSQDRRYTGNNRLKIIFDIHKKRYKTSNKEGKQKIVQYVVSSIVDDASGHFLQMQNGKYKHMSRASAVACISSAIDDATQGEKRQFRESEVQKMVQRKHKKAILDRVRKAKRGMWSQGSFSQSSLPTTFTAFQVRKNQVGSKAA
eukprot:CAMPEP_0183717164 /NCGR_PEP_ID=MMETSP0737-20130205/10851_1 /TAXON_ID=385413 /ORGANISM="Thalassiosira miniscula, Strain CCMP1093" /LENGTH=312 /DNA_ID=CAMNT_0025946551 /DNA_START=80 /DNA_END=1021 /DNA_ORIENTATION=+